MFLEALARDFKLFSSLGDDVEKVKQAFEKKSPEFWPVKIE